MPPTIPEMLAARSQLEASLKDLRKELDQARQQASLLTSTPTGPEDRSRAASLLERAQRTSIELERRKIQLENLNAQLERSGAGETSRELVDLTRTDDSLSADLAALRGNVQSALRGLAYTLRRYDEMVARKKSLSGRLSILSTRDRSYADYLDTALIRRQEYDEDLRFVLEYLQRTRVVS
jgi:chromosome segregation ATPase